MYAKFYISRGVSVVLLKSMLVWPHSDQYKFETEFEVVQHPHWILPCSQQTTCPLLDSGSFVFVSSYKSFLLIKFELSHSFEIDLKEISFEWARLE